MLVDALETSRRRVERTLRLLTRQSSHAWDGRLRFGIMLLTLDWALPIYLATLSGLRR